MSSLHPKANDPASIHFVRNHPKRVRTTTQQFIHDNRAQTSDHHRRQTTGATNAFAVYAFLVASSLSSPPRPVHAFLTSITAIDAAFIAYHDHNDASILTASSTAMALAARSVTITADMGSIEVPKGYRSALASPQASYWRDAIAKELAGLVGLHTWTLVKISSLPPGANIMGCHFIFTVKRLSDGSIEKFKARLVADGNTQKHGVDFDRIFSTVVKSSTLRLLLILAAAHQYDLHQVDIRQAYVQAEITTNLYMRTPPGTPEFDSDGDRLVCKLQRSLYGLKQAGREWATLFASFLLQWGFLRSNIDTCLFIYPSGSTFLWAAVYVDDVLLVSNNPGLRHRFMNALTKRFPTEDKGELAWLLGVAIARDRAARTITMSQSLYITDLMTKYASYISAGHTRTYDSPMEEGLVLSTTDCPSPNSADYDAMASRRSDYISIVGALLWVANMTRPDIAYATGQLSRFLTNPGTKAFNAAVRVLIYLHGSKDRHLVLRPSVDRPFVTFVDSSWTTKFSCSGAFFTLYGCVFHWFCKTQRSVTLSSAEAEYFGATLAAKDILFFRALFFDLGILAPDFPSVLLCDSKSAVDMAFDPVAFKKTKHILRAAEFLRDSVSRLLVLIKHLPGNDMVADILTKSLSRPRFIEMLKLLDSLHSTVFVSMPK